LAQRGAWAGWRAGQSFRIVLRWTLNEATLLQSDRRHGKFRPLAWRHRSLESRDDDGAIGQDWIRQHCVQKLIVGDRRVVQTKFGVRGLPSHLSNVALCLRHVDIWPRGKGPSTRHDYHRLTMTLVTRLTSFQSCGDATDLSDGSCSHRLHRLYGLSGRHSWELLQRARGCPGTSSVKPPARRWKRR